MNSIFYFFCVAIAITSVVSLPTTSAPLISTAVKTFCQAVPNNTALVSLYYKELLIVLNSKQNVVDDFPTTLAYLNNKNEKAALLSGGDSCVQFFVGLEDAIVTDLQANGWSLQSAVQQLVQYVDNIIATILSNKG